MTQKQQSTKFYRDSSGRTRRERPMFLGMITSSGANPPQTSPSIVEIIHRLQQN